VHGDNLGDLNQFAPKMVEQFKAIPIISDVSSDQQNRGLQAMIQYDRGTTARFGITPQLIDDTLYDAFGQRPVSTMYTSLNQYHVVMEASPEFWQNPLFLRQIYVDSPGGQQVPLSAFAKFASTTAPLTVTYQGLFPAVTISFNLKPGVALGDAVTATTAAAAKVGLPPTILTQSAGTA
jgi:multidrug efflux pump subunit AcrB